MCGRRCIFNYNQMKRKFKSMKNLKTRWLGLSAIALTLITSCSSEFDKVTPASPDQGAGAQFKAPKVLYIIADGARGASVRDADIPSIRALLPNSIYSWNSLADATQQTNASNWADMITGVKKEKHGVVSEDFAGNKLAQYPAIFERIKSVNKNLRVAAFAASSTFKTRLTGGADVSESFGTDLAVKNRMVEFLASDTASIVLGQFSGIENAGKASTYDLTSQSYKTAIKDFDTQVGEVLAAVKARPTYAKENWLIIITSNKGGQATLLPGQDDKTIFSNTTANTFTVMYNAAYLPTFIAKPFVGNSWSGNSPRYIGEPDKSVALASTENSKFYNFGDTNSFTISVKVKKRKNPRNTSRGDYYYQWPSILGKKNNSGWGDGQGPGWEFSLMQNGWRFFISGGVDFKNGWEVKGADFGGDSWHDLTAVVELKPDGRKYVRIYTDGVMGMKNDLGGSGGSDANPAGAKEAQLPGKPNFDNTAPLRLGWATGEIDGTYGVIDVNLAEFKIFKAALPDAVIKQYACDTSIDPSHPYYSSLIGYWPSSEGAGSRIADRGPIKADFTLQGVYKWEQYTDLVCTPALSNISVLVPKNSDIPAQILSWFNIARQASWALDGKVWISK
jgi:hypothetical protein